MKIVKFIGTLYGWLLVIALLVLVVAFICMLIGSRCRKNDDARRKQDPKSKVQPKLRKDAPQPTSDQQRLHEVEESIFWSTGAIQANPMSRGATALSEEIQHLEREKMDLLKKIADNMDQITVQKAWNTFLPEQQEKFQERIYQYQQDVNRGGTEPEIAAANRGLVFVDGRPVAKEVAARLDEMRNAVSSDNAAMISEKKFVTRPDTGVRHFY